MKNIVYIIALLAIVLGIIVFFDKDKKDSPYTKPPLAILPNTEWVMASVAEEGASVEESVLALNFKLSFDGKKSVSGKICNSFNGKYYENGPSIKVSELISTKMACENIVDRIETNFFSALSGGIIYKFEEGGLLIITDTQTGRRFFFTSENQ